MHASTGMRLHRIAARTLTAFLLGLMMFGTVAWSQTTTVVDGEISVTDQVADEAIRQRLVAVFTQLPEFAGIEVAVNAGVVSLTGSVPDRNVADKAAQMAARLEGTVAVNNNLDLMSNFSAQLERAWQMGWDRLRGLISWWPFVLVAIIVLIASTLLASFISSRDRLFERAIGNPFLRDLVKQAVRFSIIVMGILLALQLIDAIAIVGAILGAAGLLGLAVGIAFRDTLENYIAGIVMSVRQPFAPHDHISIDGIEGHVARLTGRATILITLDGNHARIPNSTVFQSTLINFTRNPLRRFDFTVGIGTDVDIAAAQTLAAETLSNLPAVLSDPAPWCVAEALGDSNVVLRIFGWMDQREANFAKLKSEAIRVVKEQFEAADFDMPEPIYRLRLSSAAAGVAQPTVPSRAGNTAVPADRPPNVDQELKMDVQPDAVIDAAVATERQMGSETDLLSNDARRE